MDGGLGKAKEDNHMLQMCWVCMSSEMYKMCVFSKGRVLWCHLPSGVGVSFLIHCFWQLTLNLLTRVFSILPVRTSVFNNY